MSLIEKNEEYETESKELEELIKDERYKSLLNLKVGGTAQAAPVVEEKPAEPEPVLEKKEFNVYLKSFDAAKKLNVIKEVRAILGLGLKDVR